MTPFSLQIKFQLHSAYDTFRALAPIFLPSTLPLPFQLYQNTCGSLSAPSKPGASIPLCALFSFSRITFFSLMSKISLSILLYSPSWQVFCVSNAPSSFPLALITFYSTPWLPVYLLESLEFMAEYQSFIFVSPVLRMVSVISLCSTNVLQQVSSEEWRRKKGTTCVGREVLRKRGRGGKALRIRCLRLCWGLNSKSAMDRWPQSSAHWPQSALHTTQSHFLIAQPSILLCPFGRGQWVWPVKSYPLKKKMKPLSLLLQWGFFPVHLISLSPCIPVHLSVIKF